jgi:hypothetical protein
MGYTLTPYAVDLDTMSAKIRNGDTAVFEAMKKKHGDEFESYQEYLDDSFDDGDDDNEGGGIIGSILSIFGKKKAPVPEPVATSADAISAEEALRHLTVGGEFVPYGGTAYGYMYEWLCEEFGERLENSQWSSLRSSSGWTGKIDAALIGSGIAKGEFSIEGTLMGRGAPLGFPHGDDFPYIGYVTAAECAKLDATFASLDIEAVANKTPYPTEAAVGLREMHSWFTTCAESNRALICFYY